MSLCIGKQRILWSFKEIYRQAEIKTCKVALLLKFLIFVRKLRKINEYTQI